MKDISILFGQEKGNYDGRMVSGYRTKRIKSGEALELEVFPILHGWTDAKLREAKSKVTSEAAAKHNRKQAAKRMFRLVNCNFSEKDITLTLTYTDGNQPASMEQALKDRRNFICRMKRLYRKFGIEPAFCATTERKARQQKGDDYHHHFILRGGIDRDLVEKCWLKGFSNSRRLQRGDDQFRSISWYMTKLSQNRSSFTCSRGLKQPEITTSDKKISCARAKKVAHEIETENIRSTFEKLYPGYEFLEAKTYYSDIITGVYIYVTMRRARR